MIEFIFSRVTFLTSANHPQQTQKVDLDKPQAVQKVQPVGDEVVKVIIIYSSLSPFSRLFTLIVFFSQDDLVELSQSTQFQALRQLIQQNPDQLQTLMQTLQATQPELFQVKLSVVK